jgi:tRNA pseudouridine55 synthase
MADGVLVIDKPAGMTSHDVVDVVRRRFGTKKVGHGGTLDPDATGVLLIGVGRATRLLSYAQNARKRYMAVARLGITTTTQDASGEPVEVREVAVDESDVATALKGFVGEIDQIPPMVSAIKVGGERLYKKARRGEDVARLPRRVCIYDAALVKFSSPRATLDIACSGGTYIRTLVHDLGTALGCGAHLESLRRTEAAGHGLENAVDLESLGRESLRPSLDAVAGLARVEVDGENARLVGDGRPIPAPSNSESGPVAVVHGGALIAVYRRTGDRLVAERVLSGKSQ